MSAETDTKLRNGKRIELSVDSSSASTIKMNDASSGDVESVDEASVSSQIAEIKDSYEKKFNSLQSEISQLNDLMLTMIEKSTNTPIIIS